MPNSAKIVDFTRMWRLDVKPMALVNRGHMATGGGPAVEVSPPPPAMLNCENKIWQQQVKSLLFADIVGYSKLREDAIEPFIEIFLHRVSVLIASSGNAPRTVNAWGDAIYAVFDFAHQAGAFAMELVQMIRDGEKEWLDHGLYLTEPEKEKDRDAVRNLPRLIELAGLRVTRIERWPSQAR